MPAHSQVGKEDMPNHAQDNVAVIEGIEDLRLAGSHVMSKKTGQAKRTEKKRIEV